MIKSIASRSKHYLLTYRYVEGMEARRGPVRPMHLQHIQTSSTVRLAGALLNPIDTGVYVFECEAKSEIESFVKDDPYFKAKLVESYTIREFAPVVNNWVQTKL